MQLQPSKSPNQPLAPTEYSRRHFDTLSNALRLYFNQIDSLFSTLFGSIGGKWVRFPHGAFHDTTNQTVSAANTPTLVKLNTTNYANGMYAVVGDGVHVEQDGIYNYQFSLQFENSDVGIQEATIWLRKNGVAVAGTSSIISVPNKHGGINGYALAAANFYVSLTAGDYVELWWATTNTSIIMEAYTASTSPYTRPSIPSAVVTLSFVSNLPA